jgi:hypothetical protein
MPEQLPQPQQPLPAPPAPLQQSVPAAAGYAPVVDPAMTVIDGSGRKPTYI